MVTDPDPRPPQETVPDLILYLTSVIGFSLLAAFVIKLIPNKQAFLTSGLAYAVNILVLTGTVYLWGIRRRKLTWAGIGFFPPRWRWYWPLIALGAVLGLMPLRAMVAIGVEFLIHGNMDSLQLRQNILTVEGTLSWGSFLLTLLGAGLLAPISEELYFRGLIHRWFQPRLGLWTRVLVSSLIFGLAHYDSVGMMVSSFIMGVVIAVAYERSRSIWLPICIHVLNNSLSTLVVYLGMWLNHS